MFQPHCPHFWVTFSREATISLPPLQNPAPGNKTFGAIRGLAFVTASKKTKKYETQFPDDFQWDYVLGTMGRQYTVLASASAYYSDVVEELEDLKATKLKGVISKNVNVGAVQLWSIAKSLKGSAWAHYPGVGYESRLIEQTVTLTLDSTRTIAANKAADDLSYAVTRCEQHLETLGYIRR
jgi:hypothetical protein